MPISLSFQHQLTAIFHKIRWKVKRNGSMNPRISLSKTRVNSLTTIPKKMILEFNPYNMSELRLMNALTLSNLQ